MSGGVLCVMAMTCCLGGCRGLRSGSREIGITEARQFSLRGADALQFKKYDDAEALFAEALRRCPSDERANWGMAEVQWHRGDCQTATTHMQEAARLSGNNPDLLVRLGEMLLEAGKLDEAMMHVESALASNWQHSGAWQLCGSIRQEQQQWQAAIDCYHRALMTKPNNPTVQMALAGLYHRTGRPQRALATLERMSDLQSQEYQSSSVYLLKGQALASLGQTEDAKLCLREAAMRADADDHRLFLHLASVQAELGQIAEARLSLGRVLRLRPDSEEALALQQRLEQQFASLVSTGGTSITGRTIDTGPLMPPDSSSTEMIQQRDSTFQLQ